MGIFLTDLGLFAAMRLNYIYSEIRWVTHPYVLPLEEVGGPRPPDGGQEPDGVGADQPLQQPDVARGERAATLTAARAVPFFGGAVLNGAHRRAAHHALHGRREGRDS